MRGERAAGWAFLAPALLLLAAFVLLPVGSAALSSLFVDTPFAPRQFVGLGNYAELFRDPGARGALGFTWVFALVSVTLELLIGMGLALVLFRALRARGWVRAAVLVPWAIPTVVAGVLWKYLVNDQYGLVNLLLYGDALEHYRAWLAEPWSARAVIVCADVWKTSPFAALILLAGLQAIPEEVLEAARVDGAGPLRRFFTITLPLLRPAILVALLFRLADAFRVFDLVYVLTQGGPGGTTSVLQFFGYQKLFPEQRFGYGSAVSVLVFAMVAAIALALVRVLRTPAEQG